MISIISSAAKTRHNRGMRSLGKHNGLLGAGERAVRELPPAAFSFVMATGIVSVAALRLHLSLFAQAFLGIAAVGYVVLIATFALKLILFRQEVLSDFQNPQKAPGFFTLVAGTSVLGVGLLKVFPLQQAALILWCFASFLYTFLIYGFLMTLITKKKADVQVQAVNGTWLLLVVGLQSISVLATALHASGVVLPLFLPIACFLVGISMYLFMLALVVGRILFLPVEPEQVIPPYWIMMGAAAISTLAGSELTLACRLETSPISYLSFIEGTTVSIWAIAVSWIPLLLCLGIWRHVLRRVRLNYEVGLWSIVFPLGMFTASSHSISKSQHYSWLPPLLPYFFCAAAAAWALVAAGFLKSQQEKFGQNQAKPSADGVGA